MSILPDTGRVAGSLPPCPGWCTLPADHGASPINQHGDVRRHHRRTVLDDPEVGAVEVVRVDEVLDTVLYAGAAMVYVTADVSQPLSQQPAMRLAEALIRATTLMERDREVTR